MAQKSSIKADPKSGIKADQSRTTHAGYDGDRWPKKRHQKRHQSRLKAASKRTQSGIKADSKRHQSGPKQNHSCRLLWRQTAKKAAPKAALDGDGWLKKAASKAASKRTQKAASKWTKAEPLMQVITETDGQKSGTKSGTSRECHGFTNPYGLM
jgi:hypothetical protein